MYQDVTVDSFPAVFESEDDENPWKMKSKRVELSK